MEVFRLVNARLPPHAVVGGEAALGPRYVPAPRYRLATASVYWRYNGWQPGALGSMYRPDYFHGGYALHGMTLVPAYPASHGCVRMTVPTMDRMWSSLWIGMPVAIYRSLPALE